MNVHKSPLQSPVTTSEIKVASIVEKLNKIITRKSLVTKFPRSTFTRKYSWQKVRGEVDKFPKYETIFKRKLNQASVSKH